jgi:6-phosphogluconolactonase
VYRFTLFDDGSVVLKSKIDMPMPSYLAIDRGLLYATLRAPFTDSADSGYVAYSLESGERVGEIASTMGEVVADLAVSEGDVYCSNYITGSVFKAPDKLVFHKGQGIDPKRQTSPHVHTVRLSPDGRYLLAADLGIDKVFVYDRDLNYVSEASVPSGAGARHLVFSLSGDFVYVVNEMGGSVSSFAYSDGKLDYLDTVSVLPEGFSGVGSGAAIKISRDGERLYVTERASQTIAVLKINGGEMTLIGSVDSHGREPRDFTLLAGDRFAVSTNQFDNTLAFFRISDSGIPVYYNSIPLPSPLCALEE